MSRTGESSSTNAAPHGYAALAGAIVEFAGSRVWPTLLVVTGAALLEGAGIVMILPIAETIFSQAEEIAGAQAGITASLTNWLANFGIDTVLEQLAVMGAVFVIFIAIRAALMLRRDVLLGQLSMGYVDYERERFFALLASADWPVIKRYRKAQLLNSMTVNIGRLAQAMHFLTRGLITATLGLATLIAAFLISLTLGLLLSGLTLAGFLFATLWSRRSFRSGQQLNLANRNVMQETVRFLDGLKAAKASRAEKRLVSGFSSRIRETRVISVSFARQQARLRNVIQLLASLAALLVLLVGYGWLGLSGGELLVMAAIILRLAPALLSTFSGVQSLAHALPAFQSLRDLEAELTKAQQGLRSRVENAAAIDLSSLEGSPLELDHCSVSVSDEHDEAITLVKTSRLIIPSGSIVLIGGPSGAGKSSLAELIAGLHLPSSGQVRWGNVSLAPETCSAWQSRIAFAPQEPFLFDGSVRENLCWPDIEADDAEIWDALKMAEADVLVQSLPRQLDEELLDGGARLSGGERQRLCIARVLLRRATLLILDEATSAMDPQLEHDIVANLRRVASGKIVIMVSHSRNAADLADLHIEVSGGEARLLA